MTTVTAKQERVEKAKTPLLKSEGLLSTLVALLSILTAVVAFHASQLDSQAGDTELSAMRDLLESNTLYLSSIQELIYDYQLYDQWVFEEDLDKEQYFFDSFTLELQESIDREQGFDDQYYNALFGDSFELEDQAWESFFMADVISEKANNLQLVMMFFALGLAFSGWASLIDESRASRASFALFAIVMLTIGSISYVWFGIGA